jgi:hypothetical protein
MVGYLSLVEQNELWNDCFSFHERIKIWKEAAGNVLEQVMNGWMFS